MSEYFLYELRGLTDRVIAVRVCMQEGYIVVGRLDEKLKMAGGVVGRITAKIEAQADDIIEREKVLEQRTEEVFSPHKTALLEASKGLDDVERQLALVSNGNPLPTSSTEKKEVFTVTAEEVGHINPNPTPPGLTRGGVTLNK